MCVFGCTCVALCLYGLYITLCLYNICNILPVACNLCSFWLINELVNFFHMILYLLVSYLRCVPMHGEIIYLFRVCCVWDDGFQGWIINIDFDDKNKKECSSHVH